MASFGCCREVEKWMRQMPLPPEEVADALQEVCLRCCLYQQRFKRPPKSRLRKVATSVCRDMLKNLKTAPIPFSQLATEEEFDPTDLLEDKWLEQRQRALRVREILEHLSPTYRKVLVWQFVEGLSHREIAERLGCKVKSVKVLLNKAKRAFKKAWQ